jgi:hypothetical protein
LASSLAYEIDALKNQKIPEQLQKIIDGLQNGDQPGIKAVHTFVAGHSSALIIEPNDPTAPLIVSFTGSNDPLDWVGPSGNSNALPSPSNSNANTGFVNSINAKITEGPYQGLSLEEAIFRQLESDPNLAGRQVIFSGHSRGGGMAQLAALHWLERTKKQHPHDYYQAIKDNTRIYTLSPASAGGDVPEQLNNLMPMERMVNVFHRKDWVPNLGTGTQPGVCLVEMEQDGKRAYCPLHIDDKIFKALFTRMPENAAYHALTVKDIVTAHDHAKRSANLLQEVVKNQVKLVEPISKTEEIKHMFKASFKKVADELSEAVGDIKGMLQGLTWNFKDTLRSNFDPNNLPPKNKQNSPTTGKPGSLQGR